MEQTVEKTYTLDELTGPPQKWVHIESETPMVALCGYHGKAVVLDKDTVEKYPICPDCKRIADRAYPGWEFRYD